jgi:uncharacterized protein YndB with AHSA1/START domain
MNMTNADRIEKKALLRAPRPSVWQALADAGTFGGWFGVDLAGPFVVGTRVRGKFTHEAYEHVPFEVTVERMEPERLFSWRRHHHPVEPGADHEAAPTTLVVFELDEVEDGTQLTVVEAGFDGIPLSRRAEMYRAHEDGWTQQLESIRRYVEGAA